MSYENFFLGLIYLFRMLISRSMFLQMASVYSLFFFFRSVGTLNWPVYSDHPGFPGGTVIKSLPADAGDARDVGSIPVLGRSPGVGNGRPLQYSCLGNPIDR